MHIKCRFGLFSTSSMPQFLPNLSIQFNFHVSRANLENSSSEMSFYNHLKVYSQKESVFSTKEIRIF